LFASVCSHVVKGGLRFGGDCAETATECFAAFTVCCQIKAHRYTRKRALFLKLRRSPVDGFHAGQINVPFWGGLCYRVGKDKETVI
jgi:hypothetical protein